MSVGLRDKCFDRAVALGGEEGRSDWDLVEILTEDGSSDIRLDLARS